MIHFNRLTWSNHRWPWWRTLTNGSDVKSIFPRRLAHSLWTSCRSWWSFSPARCPELGPVPRPRLRWSAVCQGTGCPPDGSGSTCGWVRSPGEGGREGGDGNIVICNPRDNGKWFEPRSGNSLVVVTFWVRVVLRKTVESDWSLLTVFLKINRTGKVTTTKPRYDDNNNNNL